MKRKFLNTDPLNKNVFLGGSNYKTGEYPQAMYLPDENEPMIFLKELEHCQLFIGLTPLKTWALNQQDENHFHVYCKNQAKWILEKMEEGCTTFDWKEVILESNVKFSMHPPDWTEEEIREYVIKHELHKETDEDEFVHDRWQRKIDQLTACIIDEHVEAGKIALRDKESGNFVTAIFYNGEGSQVGPLCGSGGIEWTYKGEEILYRSTWIS